MAFNMWAPTMGGAPSPAGGNMAAPFVPQGQDFSAPPPNGPEELKEREGGWAKVQAFLQNPDMQMGLLRMGLMMMQPVPVGQTPLGHAAAALGSSVDYLGAVQQQRQLMQQRAANIENVQAQTQHQRAVTGTQLPAEVQRIGATTRLLGAQANRSETLLPKEVEAMVQDIALKEWQLKDAPTESMRKEVQRRREELQLVLDEMYGSGDRDLSQQVRLSEIRYRDALARGQDALAERYKQEGAKGKNWTIKNVTRDPDTGAMTIVSGHADGRQRVVTLTSGQSIADAKAQASRDVKAMSKDELAERFPGMSKDQAVEALAKDLQRAKTNVQDFDASGVPVGQTQPGKDRGPGPVQPQSTLAVPPALKDKPDGTIVPDDEGKWWVKRGGRMMQATEQDIARAKKPTQPAKPTTSAVEDATPEVRDVPNGISKEVAERYTTTASRGKPSKFDYAAYDADMKELQTLVKQVEDGDVNLSIAVGRIKLLSHKLGVPEPSPQYKPKPQSSTPTPAPQAAAQRSKFKMHIRRGDDGKLAGFDVEEA